MELLKISPLFLEHKNIFPEVSSREIEAYEVFFELLQKWNLEMALVSKTKIQNSFSIHFVDSIWITELMGPFLQSNVFDIGSGAGFPGLVFAIRNPTQKITLFEKSGKKRSFLSEVVTQLELTNVTLEEVVPQQKLQGSFFARAVRPPEELIKWLKTVLAPGSILSINYGGEASTLLKPPGFKILDEKKYELPQGEGFRKIQFLERQ